MDFQLKQRGRASMHFLSDLAVATGPLKAKIDADLLARGLDDGALADDLDERMLQVDAALADSSAAAALAMLGEYSGVNHGRVAAAAFEEIVWIDGETYKGAGPGPGQEIQQIIDSIQFE